MDGHPTDAQARLRLELLREVRGVQPRIPALGQGEDLLLGGRGEAAPRGLAPIAVDQGVLAVGPQPGEEPPDVPLAQVQTRGGLGAGEPVLPHQAERVIAVEIALTHGRQRVGWGHGPSWGEKESPAPRTSCRAPPPAPRGGQSASSDSLRGLRLTDPEVARLGSFPVSGGETACRPIRGTGGAETRRARGPEDR